MIEAIKNNPYRVLGTYANATKKERLANESRIKAFQKVGKEVTFPLDLTKVLGSVDRTESSVQSAESALSLPKDRLRHGQFWFLNLTPVDAIAFQHLTADGGNTAVGGIWERADNVSSLQNRLVLSLISEDYKEAVQLAHLLYEDKKDSFVSALVGDEYSPDVSELSGNLLGAISQVVGSKGLLRLLPASDPWRKELIEREVIPLIDELEVLIKQAKSVQRDDVSGNLEAGTKLMKKGHKLILTLRKLLPRSDLKYQMIADKFGLQVLQNGINYFNNSETEDRYENAMKLQEYALGIVEGSMAKQRCQENVEILRKMIAELPPQEIRKETEEIMSRVQRFSGEGASIANINRFLDYVVPRLTQMKGKVGAVSDQYLKLSSLVVSAALHDLVSVVNEAQSTVTRTVYGGVLGIDSLKQTLRNAWLITRRLDDLDKSADVKSHYDNNRRLLNDLCTQLDIEKRTDEEIQQQKRVQQKTTVTQEKESSDPSCSVILWIIFVIFILISIINS